MSEMRSADVATGRRRSAEGAYPPYLFEDYRSTRLRAPLRPLVDLPPEHHVGTGPGPGLARSVIPDTDLTRNAGTGGEAVGERIVVTGTVFDRDREPVPNALVEVWQANAAGRYIHDKDRHDAPLDPDFLGIGRCITDGSGRYRFVTIKPGAYPWRNHENAWRPAHIHFSLFGMSFTERLVTQMYFPGDPLHALDPILASVPSDEARERLVARYAHDVTEPEWALGYRFDIVIGGADRTPFEAGPHGS